MNIKQHIPNFITILNLVCGVFAIMFFIKDLELAGKSIWLSHLPRNSYIEYGTYLIFAALVFDFLDGFVARLLKVQSEIGAQLDSLADMITFGVAPGFLYFVISFQFSPELNFINFLFILIPIFSALRLAKFNVDTEQSDYFKGLATPANAIFWVGIFYLEQSNLFGSILSSASIILVIIMSILMTSNLRMFSLKLKNLKLEGDNIYRVILVVGAIVLTIIFGLFTNIMAAIPFIIIMYILLSIHYHYNTKTTK